MAEWLDFTFSSKSKAEQLLRPELENGTLSLHDYDLAVRFLPGYHRHWPVLYAVTATTAAAAYGKLRRHPWTVARTSVVTGLIGFVGITYGQFRRARAHWIFTQSLDDPEGFMQVLQNVNTRTGGVKPLGFTLPNVRRVAGAMSTSTESSGIDVVQDGDWEIRPENQDRDQHQTSMANPQTPSLARWDQIRAANARIAGRNSSWDALRQRHERSIISSSQTTSGKEPNDRLSEQARFDAMVEAERRNSQL